MNLKAFYISVSFIVIVNFSCLGQEISEIIRLHRDNMTHLSASRGVKPTWLVPTNFNEKHLIKTLSQFYGNKKVGILIYTHENDSLNITILNSKELIYSKSFAYIKSDLERDIGRTNSYFSQINSSNDLNRGAISTSIKNNSLKEAYHNLINKILPNDIDYEAFEHLIIVPCLNLGTLPFGALKLSDSDFLIDKMSYSISPSIFEIYSSIKSISKSKFTESYFYWSNPLFIYKTKFSYPDNSKFSDLIYTEVEVNSIISNLDTKKIKVLKNDTATKDNFLQELRHENSWYGGYERGLIYFATHGVSSSTNALDESFIVLTNEDDTNIDILTAREIQKLYLHNIKLVVLSACESGLGKTHTGGVIGLSRAFQIAGVKHVLMSLWSISDSETAKFMNIFFNQLSKSRNSHLDPHESLRKAILIFRKTVSDNPKYWAAFSIFGVPNPIKAAYNKTNRDLNEFYKNIIVKNKNGVFTENNDLKFEIKLLPVEYDILNEKVGAILDESDFMNDYGVLEFNEDDYGILQIINKSDYPIYVNIVEVNKEGQITPLFPMKFCSQSDNMRKINPKETKTFDDCVLSFGPPEGHFILKGIATSSALDFDFLSVNQVNLSDSMVEQWRQEYPEYYNSNFFPEVKIRNTKVNKENKAGTKIEGFTTEFRYMQN